MTTKINKGFAQYINTKKSRKASKKLPKAIVAPSNAYSSLMSLTKQELYEMAQNQNVKGRSKMTKEQLVIALA